MTITSFPKAYFREHRVLPRPPPPVCSSRCRDQGQALPSALQQQMPSKIERLGMRLERVPRNQARAQFRERSFLFPRKMSVEIFRYDKLKDSIAQKFQALIVLVIALFFVTETGMSQSLFE